MNKPQAVSSNQKGFASLVVALIMIIVLSLLMVGFARLARREQQNSLDKQLATQAYYAAESGINDLTKAVPTIQQYVQSNTIDPNSCLSAAQIAGINAIPGGVKLPSSDIDTNNGISYTCALVNTKPPSLIRNGLPAQSAWNMNFSTTGDLSSMKISWGSSDSHYTYRPAGATDLPPFSQWNNAPAVLQYSVTPLDDVSRNGLTNTAFTAYLYPSSSGSGSVTYDPANNAPIVSGNCSGNSGYTCNVTINGLPGNANSYYLVRITGYYDTSDISINTLRDAGGVELLAVDGQAQLDVTGKAKNVLKRIQVRTPIGSNDKGYTLPPGALEAQSICKRMATYPGSATDNTPYGDGPNGVCNLGYQRN